MAVRIDFADQARIFKTLLFSRRTIVNDFKQDIIKTTGFKFVELYSTARYRMMMLLKTLHSNDPVRDEVILPGYICPTVLFSIVNAGLKPVVADIDISTLNVDPAKVHEKISQKTLAVIAADMFGNGAELNELYKILRSRKVFIIQDAAQSFPEIDDYSGYQSPDFAVISFGKGKYLTTVQGGAIVSNNNLILKQLNESILLEPVASVKQQLVLLIKMIMFPLLIKPEFFRFVFSIVKNEIQSANLDQIPANWKFSRIQAAMGITMIKKLGTLKIQRQINSEFYYRLLSKIPQINLPPRMNNKFLRFCLLIEEEATFRKIKYKLEERGFMISIPEFRLNIYESYFESSDISAFINSEFVYRHLLCLPTHGYVNERDTETIANIISSEITRN